MLKIQKDKATFLVPQELIDHLNKTDHSYLRQNMANKQHQINDTRIWGRERLIRWVAARDRVERQGRIQQREVIEEDVSF